MRTKILFIAWLTLSFNLGFSQNTIAEQSLINNFLSSNEYNRIINESATSLGELYLDSCNIVYVDKDETKPVINVPFGVNGIIKGIIEAVPIPNTYNNILPENAHYAMSLIDYREYDIEAKTGRIKITDLNYDGYTAIDALVSSGEITNLISNEMPEEISSKYSNLLKKADLGNALYSEDNMNVIAPPHFCDQNRNGNVSFGECYSCMSSACNGQPNCAVLCAAINVAGLLSRRGGLCTISMGAACLYIAIRY